MNNNCMKFKGWLLDIPKSNRHYSMVLSVRAKKHLKAKYGVSRCPAIIDLYLGHDGFIVLKQGMYSSLNKQFRNAIISVHYSVAELVVTEMLYGSELWQHGQLIHFTCLDRFYEELHLAI